MKTLLYKQLRLVCHPMTPVFCLFGFMVIIPNYPYTVIFFYVMLGLFFHLSEYAGAEGPVLHGAAAGAQAGRGEAPAVCSRR